MEFQKIYTSENAKNILIKYLLKRNNNIDWSNFLEKNFGRPDLYILKKIKSALWIDKDEEYELYDSLLYIDYYTKLLNKYDLKKKNISILTYINSELFPEYLIKTLNRKINILEQVLNIYSIEYKSYDNIIEAYNNSEFIVLTGSITIPSIESLEIKELFNKNINKLILDNEYSIVKNIDEIKAYNIIHLIENYLYDEDSSIYKYYYVVI